MTGIDPLIDSTLKEEPKEAPPVAPVGDIAPENEPNSNILIWTFAIIGILILGIFLIRVFYDPEPVRPGVPMVEYNNWEFEYYDGLWWTAWQRENIQFILSLRYNPVQTLNITVSGEISPTFERDTIYISFDPTAEKHTYVALAAAELTLNLARAIGVNTIAACTNDGHPACENRPIVNCDSENVSVIVLSETNNTAGISLQGDCMTLHGKELELVRSVDRMVYTFYGIIRSLDPEQV